LKSNRKTGFLGIIICLENLINLYKIINGEDMSYILSHKFSQDHIEIFFSAVRNRGGFNNNPNAVQFRAAYKRLLIRHEIQGSMNGNCLLLDNCSTLLVGTSKRTDDIAIVTNNNNELNDKPFFDGFDHDYYSQRFLCMEEYVVDIAKYTSGFIVRKIKR